MAQTYTLEEAADKLNIPSDEFKRRLREDPAWKNIRSFRDGSTLRFRGNDVDELARIMGMGSDPDLQLSYPSDELPATATPAAHASDVENLIILGDDGPALGDQDIFLMADEPAPAPASPSGKIKKSSAIKPGSDSDIRLEKADKKKAAAADDSDSILTEEIDLGVLGGGSSGKLTGSSKGKLSPSSSKLAKGGSGKIAASNIDKTSAMPTDEEDSSEFELSLDPDSSDEFELSLTNDSSGEISLGDAPVPAAGPRSGINLGKPADSGVSLEGKSGKGKKPAPAPAADDEEIDFELSLDSGSSSVKGGASGKMKKPNLDADSDSEFELTLDGDSDSGISASLDAETSSYSPEEEKGDIFETDFEIPALDDDSASEAIALDESDTDLDSSDFDLEVAEGEVALDDESASEVVALDDEVEPAKGKKGAKKKKKPVASDVVVADDDAVSFDDMDLDESISASQALKDVKNEGEEDDDDAPTARTVVVGTAPWGALPAIIMFPTILVMFVAGIMGYELMHSIWGYHQPTKPTSIVVDKVAETFDLKPKE